jgi:hypothetical protein
MLRLYTTVGPIKSQQRKRVATSDGRGHMWTPNGFIVGNVEIYIDVDKLQGKAYRAVSNRNKKSVLASGAIVFKAINLRNEAQ